MTATIEFVAESEIERRAQELLAKHAVHSPPVDPIAIAFAEGVEVYTADFGRREVAGVLQPSTESMSKWEILINQNDPPRRQRFTVAHELGHFVLHRKYKERFIDEEVFFRASLQEQEFKGADRRMEIQANLFAAALLMPREMLLDVLDETDDLTDLATIFYVSRPAMAYRVASVLEVEI